MQSELFKFRSRSGDYSEINYKIVDIIQHYKENVQSIEQELLKNVNLTSLNKKITKIKSNDEVDIDQDKIEKLLNTRGDIIHEYDKLSGD
jgi:uncharacterized membrane-anchored protein